MDFCCSRSVPQPVPNRTSVCPVCSALSFSLISYVTSPKEETTIYLFWAAFFLKINLLLRMASVSSRILLMFFLLIMGFVPSNVKVFFSCFSYVFAFGFRAFFSLDVIFCVHCMVGPSSSLTGHSGAQHNVTCSRCGLLFS